VAVFRACARLLAGTGGRGKAKAKIGKAKAKIGKAKAKIGKAKAKISERAVNGPQSGRWLE